MLIQNKLIDAAKIIVSSSLAANGITDWTVYGMFDTTPQQGIRFPSVRIQCFDDEPLYKENLSGWHKTTLELITTAIRLTGSMSGGTSASEFETVSDMVFNPFIGSQAVSSMSAVVNNMSIQGIFEDGLEATPLTDGWIATQKIQVVCARTS